MREPRVEIYADGGTQWIPEETPSSVRAQLVPTCHKVLELFASGANAMPEQARRAILAYMEAGRELEMSFVLQKDGSMKVRASLNDTPLFEVSTRSGTQETSH